MMQTALIISHGQPSDPEPAALENQRLAAQVAAYLPGWQVLGPTLAEPEALGHAVAQAGGRGYVYPMFMADGWFTKDHLPKRLAQAGGQDFIALSPFGLDPLVQDLACQIVAAEGADVELLLAAHGSFRSRRPAEVAQLLTQDIAKRLDLRRAEAAFIDQEPQLSGVTGFGENAVCLPFFAANGGHVTQDLPQALHEAGFKGRLLRPLGCHPAVPQLIARAILAKSQLPLSAGP